VKLAPHIWFQLIKVILVEERNCEFGFITFLNVFQHFCGSKSFTISWLMYELNFITFLVIYVQFRSVTVKCDRIDVVMLTSQSTSSSSILTNDIRFPNRILFLVCALNKPGQVTSHSLRPNQPFSVLNQPKPVHTNAVLFHSITVSLYSYVASCEWLLFTKFFVHIVWLIQGILLAYCNNPLITAKVMKFFDN
jgi:hypothetical protein